VQPFTLKKASDLCDGNRGIYPFAKEDVKQRKQETIQKKFCNDAHNPAN
jgi:hypothetical protein